MKNKNIISAIGLAWLFLSLSQIPIHLYPLPFQRNEGIKALSHEFEKSPQFIKEEVGLANKRQENLEKSLTKEIRIVWIKSLIYISFGFLAGLFIIKKKKKGRIIALALSGYIIFTGIYDIFSSQHAWQRLSPKFYVMRLEQFPAQTILGSITLMLAILTVILFSRTGVSKEFNNIERKT